VRRRRGALLGLAVAVVAVAVVLAVRPGGSPDRLAGLAPPDALGWVHTSTGGGDDGLWSPARRFPTLADLPGRLAGAFGLAASRLDVARDVRPWLGGEAGVALVDAGGRSAPLLLAAVDDRAAADAALRRLGARPAGGGGLYSLAAPGTAAGLTARVLAAGPERAVRAALARDAGRGGPGLASTPGYRRAIAARGAGALDAYASAAGVRRLLSASSPLVRAAAALAAGPALEAVAAEAEPAEGGVRVHARVLRGPAAPAPASFAPGLLGRVPLESTAAVVAMPGGDALAALAARLGGAAALSALRAAARGAGVDLDRDVLGPLRGDAVLSLQARGQTPVLSLVARTVAPATTRDALARLQAPVAHRLTGGAARGFDAVGAGAFTLPVTARLQPSYGVSGDVLVASTAQLGLEQARAAARGAPQAPALAPLADLAGGRVQALGFLDLQALLRLGERTGLTAGSGFGAARADLVPVRAAGAVVRQGPDHPTDTTAELFLQIP
jgi:hypothetical protein